MIKVFFRYHMWRFKQYWRNEGRTARKDLLSAKLFSRVGLMFSLGFLLVFIIGRDVDYLFAAFAFLAYGIATHVYRDYRQNLSYCVGWNRRMKKEAALRHREGARDGG